MKKVVLYLCTGILVFGLSACGKRGQEESSSQESEISSSPEAGSGTGESSDVAGDDQSSEDSGVASGAPSEGLSGVGDSQAPEESSDAAVGDGTVSWSEEMGALRQAVVDALGEDNYWPNMPMDAELFEMFMGVTPDMYEDYMAETPMISGNVDALVIVKAKEDKVDAVEETLTNYREANVNDTMQYPQNVGKIQASQVERIGNYVIFVQLGGFAIEAETEEEVISQCKEANQLAMDTIRGILEGNQ